MAVITHKVLGYFGNFFVGTYIDVGAFDGVTQNQTRLLASSGWSGMCIEPSPIQYELLKRNRASAIRINGLVGKENVDGLSYIYYDNVPQFSGVNPDPEKVLFAHEFHKQRLVAHVYPINCYRLVDLVRKYLLGRPIHFLKVDVEGMEMDVLKGLESVRPTMICVENNDSRNKELDSFMVGMGYRVHAVVDWDTLYVRV